MTLRDRYRANLCAVEGCERQRHPDAAVCRDDLAELFARRLDRQPDGTFTRRRTFPARDDSGWLRAA